MGSLICKIGANELLYEFPSVASKVVHNIDMKVKDFCFICYVAFDATSELIYVKVLLVLLSSTLFLGEL